MERARFSIRSADSITSNTVVAAPRAARRGLRVGATLFAGAIAIAACGGESRSGWGEDNDPNAPAGNGNGGNGNGSLGGAAEAGTTAPTSGIGCGKMDIIFVIDDSGSMGQEQTNLGANFPKFVDILDQQVAGNGAPLDYRVAVTTTGKSYKLKTFGLFEEDVDGDDGAFRNNCGGSQRWLEKADAKASFPCRASVGTGGPTEEMPLECMKLAVKDRVADGTNAGFFRDDALLAVVFLTDEDDCSFSATTLNEGFSDLCDEASEPPENYVKVLDEVKGDRAKWATAVIAGKTSCESTFGAAAEAKRLSKFVTAVGKNAVFSSICEGDLTKPLSEAINKFGEACKSFPGGPK